MGSPLSFPVLCLANLIGYWISLEHYAYERSKRTGEKTRTFQFEDLAALVNGDDILNLTNDAHFQIWKRVMADFGLDLSPGKSLRHSFMLTINSQQWRFEREGGDPRSCKGKFTLIPYFAVGLLLTGGETKEIKVQAAEGSSELITREVQDLASTWNDLRPTAFDQCRAFARFLEIHKATLRLLSRGGLLNFFASRQAGGLGLVPPEPGEEGPWDFGFTRPQRRLCFLRHIDNAGRIVSTNSRPFSRPVLARTVVKETFPNIDLNANDGFFLGCPIFPDGVDVLPPIVDGGEWIPLLADPEKVIVNSSVERFARCDNDGRMEVEFDFCLPSEREIQSVFKQKDWSSGIATVGEMTQEYMYVPVRFFPTVAE